MVADPRRRSAVVAGKYHVEKARLLHEHECSIIGELRTRIIKERYARCCGLSAIERGEFAYWVGRGHVVARSTRLLFNRPLNGGGWVWRTDAMYG